MVILGGGMAKVRDLLFKPVRKYVREHAFTAATEGVKIVPAALGVNAGAIGAVAYVLKKKGLLKTMEYFDPNLIKPSRG